MILAWEAAAKGTIPSGWKQIVLETLSWLPHWWLCSLLYNLIISLDHITLCIYSSVQSPLLPSSSAMRAITSQYCQSSHKVFVFVFYTGTLSPTLAIQHLESVSICKLTSIFVPLETIGGNSAVRWEDVSARMSDRLWGWWSPNTRLKTSKQAPSGSHLTDIYVGWMDYFREFGYFHSNYRIVLGYWTTVVEYIQVLYLYADLRYLCENISSFTNVISCFSF